jgi:hypothetical protein
VGGGIDIAINNSVAIRLIQVDYNMAIHPKRFYTNEDEWIPRNKTYNNLNLSFGIVFRLGN